MKQRTQTRHLPKNRKRPRDKAAVMRDIWNKRTMTDEELRIAREFIELLPFDAEVQVNFFFGADKWKKLEVDERRALGLNFSFMVRMGKITGVMRIKTSGSNRWRRIEVEPNSSEDD